MTTTATKTRYSLIIKRIEAGRMTLDQGMACYDTEEEALQAKAIAEEETTTFGTFYEVEAIQVPEDVLALWGVLQGN